MNDYPGFSEFVAARSAALFRLAYLLTGERTTAEDLLQEALTRTVVHWRTASRYDSPEAYVRRTMYHRAVSGWRRRRRIHEEPVADPTSGIRPEQPGTAPGDEAGAVRRILLADALARLTSRQRAVLVLRFYEDLGAQETAELLGCSVGTVKSQTHHALKRLRELAPELAEFTMEVTQ